MIYNPHDSQSFKRIINVPKRGIGDETIKKIFTASIDNNFIEVLQNISSYNEFSAGIKSKLLSFYNLIADFQTAFTKMDLPAFIAYIIEKTGYLEDIKENEDIDTYRSRKENLDEFINVASEFIPQDKDILGEFLSQVSLVSDIDSYTDETSAITLMTLHSAKGLEFDTVFLSPLSLI